MSTPAKRKAPPKPSPLVRLAKILYFVLFGLSLVVVIGFAALKLFAPEPTVDSQVPIPPQPAGPSAPPAATDNPDGTPEPTPLVLTRPKGVYTCLLLGVADMGGSDTIMLGVFGVHNFYLGFNTRGTIQLVLSLAGGLLTCGVATVAVVIWAFIEGVMLLSAQPSRMYDGNGVILRD